jgi:dynamin 1-like protein
LAESVDPKRDRTIGVITKIDLMDEGTDALEILNNSTYSLDLGYYGVKCRSQQNIINGVTVKESIERERKYFESHHVYAPHAKTLGIPYLSKRLNMILIAHIKKCIPTLNR